MPEQLHEDGCNVDHDPWITCQDANPGLILGPLTGPEIARIVHRNAPITTNDQGGSQSHIPVRFDLIDAKALFATAAVLHEGAEKYGENNWRKIPVEDHLNHLIMHAYAYLSGDRTDDHLSHIICRATFAYGVEHEQDGQG